MNDLETAARELVRAVEDLEEKGTDELAAADAAEQVTQQSPN